jgi:hypothetical protein
MKSPCVYALNLAPKSNLGLIELPRCFWFLLHSAVFDAPVLRPVRMRDRRRVTEHGLPWLPDAMKAFVGQPFQAAGLSPGVSLSQRKTQFPTEAFDRADASSPAVNPGR